MPDFPKRYSIYFADLNPTIGAEIRKVGSRSTALARTPRSR